MQGRQVIMQVFEIHRYRGGEFQYVVARTNKHSEDYVKKDVEKMNVLLSPEMKAVGIRYAFALGTVDSIVKKTGEKKKKVAEKVELSPA